MAQGVKTTRLKFSAYAGIGITVMRDQYIVVKKETSEDPKFC